MEGHFVHKKVLMRWTVQQDPEPDEDGGEGWILEVRVAGVSGLQRYPAEISQIQAERDARKVAPILLPIAAAWMNSQTPSS
jgi:hypothetical protein